jgi:RNA polymerase sigma factor (TIGR02999 family)
MSCDPEEQVSLLLEQMRGGDPQAADRFVSIVFHELHRLAQLYLSQERPGHTLQPTALVNEAYLRLAGEQAPDWRNRAHFIGATASVMRRILVDHARRKQALKRRPGGPVMERQETPGLLTSEEAEELLALNDALDRLEIMNSRQRQVVELRYIGGLSIEETAEALGVSLITVKRDWVAARAWLKEQVRPTISKGETHGGGRAARPVE